MCDCVAQVNEMLAKEKTCIDQISLINFKTGNVRQSMHIATAKTERGRHKAKTLLPTFCPFCGEKIAKDSEASAA